MKKLDSNHDKETPQEELNVFVKSARSLHLKKTSSRLSMTKPRRNLKKRRSEDNIDRRTKSVTFEPVPRHRFPLIVIQLCVLIYMRTLCGL